MSKYWRMPVCRGKVVHEIDDAIKKLKRPDRVKALAMQSKMAPNGMCVLLHAMRRWYSYNTYNAAKKIISFRALLDKYAMDLRPSSAVGCYRGFKVKKNDKLASKKVGDIFTLPVARNGGCSSWTTDRKRANNFSGASKTHVGIVIKLVGTAGLLPFIAPPSHTNGWFDRLYKSTMGKSFRFKEDEYAVYGKRLVVQVVAIKKR